MGVTDSSEKGKSQSLKIEKIEKGGKQRSRGRGTQTPPRGIRIVGGPYHFFIQVSQKIYGVGRNEVFQLGDQGEGDGRDSYSSRRVPLQINIPGNPTILRFSNGLFSRTTVVLTEKGLYGCGLGSQGQFGDSWMYLDERKEDRPTMKLIEYFKKDKVQNYFSEGGGLWVILASNKVLRSGRNFSGTLSSDDADKNLCFFEELRMNFLLSEKEKVVDIKAFNHTLLLSDCGNVYGCGDGDSGSLGMGIRETGQRHQFKSILPVSIKNSRIFWSCIAVGYGHSLFLTRYHGQGIPFSCGNGRQGQSGDNRKRNRYVATKIHSLDHVNIKSVVCGAFFSMFLSERGDVFACGRNNVYQLGTGEKESVFMPTQVAKKIVQVATTLESTSLLTDEGKVFSVGNNSFGQCCVRSFDPVIRSLTNILMPGGTESLFSTSPNELFDTVIHVFHFGMREGVVALEEKEREAKNV